MQIDYLADHPEFIPVLAAWHHAEWAYLRPGETLRARTARLRGYCGHREIPTALIAYSGESLIGSALLIPQDMHTRLEWSPWLASVFVASERRRQGVGAALVRRVIEEATALGVARVYLYTPGAESFYTKLGWTVVERREYRGIKVTVMAYATSDPGSAAQAGTGSRSAKPPASGMREVPEFD